MVVQKTLNTLKERPDDEKKAVASGVAIGFVIILLIAWSFFFVKKVQNGATTRLGGGVQDEFNFTSVKDAQKQLKENYQNTADELKQIRDSAVTNSLPVQNALPDPGTQSGGFGTPDTSN